MADAAKKLVLKVDLHDERDKRKAIIAVSSLEGIDFISVDMKENKLTLTGTVDPVAVVGKLRKRWHADVLSVGLAKEPEKSTKKEDAPKKPAEGDKDKKGKDGDAQRIAEWWIRDYQPPYPHQTMYYYSVHSADEDPNACVVM